jgi:hypothetical protein
MPPQVFHLGANCIRQLIKTKAANSNPLSLPNFTSMTGGNSVIARQIAVGK